jgi:hypothetical protein
MLSQETPTFEELQATKWTRKGFFRGNQLFPETLPRTSVNTDDLDVNLRLSRNELIYHGGKWIDLTNTEQVPTTVNPIVSENICLKKRVETLIRTAAISDIEVQQLKDDIRDAKQILEQLAQVM